MLKRCPFCAALVCSVEATDYHLKKKGIRALPINFCSVTQTSEFMMNHEAMEIGAGELQSAHEAEGAAEVQYTTMKKMKMAII